MIFFITSTDLVQTLVGAFLYNTLNEKFIPISIREV